MKGNQKEQEMREWFTKNEVGVVFTSEVTARQ